MNYIELFFKADERTAEIITALLMHEGFEGMEQNEDCYKAFIQKNLFNLKLIKTLFDKWKIVFEHKEIQNQNWNEEWEANFHPVQVESFVNIRASFHPTNQQVEYEIIINPKMSFGTGHHATTWLMMQQMREINFTNKEVIDFGTGTGILSILSEKLGAKHITAIDYDDNCIENASENINLNHCEKIRLLKADSIVGQAHIILANINKNIILANMPGIVDSAKDGIVLFSGLLTGDFEDLIESFKSNQMNLITKVERDNWICLLCQC